MSLSMKNCMKRTSILPNRRASETGTPGGCPITGRGWDEEDAVRSPRGSPRSSPRPNLRLWRENWTTPTPARPTVCAKVWPCCAWACHPRKDDSVYHLRPPWQDLRDRDLRWC